MKLIILFSLFLANVVSAASLDTYTSGFRMIRHRSELTVLACQAVLEKQALYFEETDPLGYCNVENQPALGSLANCLTLTNNTKAIDVFVKDCATKTDFTMDDFNAAYENATQHLVNQTADPTFNLTEIYNKPVELSSSLVFRGVESTVNRYQNYNYGSIFGVVLISYWFLVIIASGVWNFMKFATPGVVKSFGGKFSNKFRSWITVPATFGKRHSEYFYIFKFIPTLIPTRWESIMIGGWLVLVLAFNVTDYEHNVGNTIWAIQSSEMGRKIADRTGMEILFLMPTLILFAGRNNFLQLVTGWHYSRFVLVHKWVARIATLLTMLHAVGMTYNGKGIGKYELRNTHAYVRWGMVACVSMFLMCFLAISALRKNNYELFLLIHILLAVFAVVGGWYHTEDPGYTEFYSAAAAVWAFDRFVRIVRLIGFGVRTADVQLKANETVKVTVSKPPYWKTFPGAHAYIHFFRPTMFWQSHPFTIVESSEDKGTITFYLKVKGGMTHGLLKYLSNQPEQKAKIKVSVEGPYGKRYPLSRYDSNLMIASGNGVPGLYAEARDLVAKQTNANVKFVWIIRHFKSIEWFYEELLKLNHPNIDLSIYITRSEAGVHQFWNDSTTETETDSKEQAEKESSEAEGKDLVAELKTRLDHATFVEGRPDLNQIISTEISEAKGSLAVSTCCHASIDDDVRRYVAHNLGASDKRVELFDQIQVW